MRLNAIALACAMQTRSHQKMIESISSLSEMCIELARHYSHVFLRIEPVSRFRLTKTDVFRRFPVPLMPPEGLFILRHAAQTVFPLSGFLLR